MYGSVVSLPLCSRSPISTMGRVITVGPSKGISKYRWVCNSKPNGDVWSICPASATNRPLRQITDINNWIPYRQINHRPIAYHCRNRPKSPNQGLSNLSNSHNPEMGQSVRWESKKAIKSAANFFSMFRLSIIQMIWVGAPTHFCRWNQLHQLAQLVSSWLNQHSQFNAVFEV